MKTISVSSEAGNAHEVVPLAEAMECLLLTLVDPTGAVLQSHIYLGPGCTANAGQGNLE